VAIPARRIAACAGAADAEPPHPAPPSGDPVLPARTAVKGRGRAMRRLAYGVLAVAAALALLGVVLYAAGARQTVATLARLSGPELLVLVVTAFGVTLFSALAWQAILERDGHALPLWLLASPHHAGARRHVHRDHVPDLRALAARRHRHLRGRYRGRLRGPRPLTGRWRCLRDDHPRRRARRRRGRLSLPRPSRPERRGAVEGRRRACARSAAGARGASSRLICSLTPMASSPRSGR